MSMPRIGLVSQWDGRSSVYNMSPGYVQWVERAGGLPVIFPFLETDQAWEAAVQGLDGILLTGGPDVDPRYYGEEPIDACGDPQPVRDEAERSIFELGVKKHGLPVLGICKGCQVINVMMGGSLYQDIHIQHEGDKSICHRQPQKDHVASHDATILQGTPLYAALGKENIRINSFHHQSAKVLGSGLQVMATAPDGVIEAFYAQTGFIWGIQWHPEKFKEENQDTLKIFQAFVRACKK